MKLSIEPLDFYRSFETICNTILLLSIKFMQQIYLKMLLHDNLTINASLFMLLISLLILWVKKICGNIQNWFIEGYSVHA